VSAGLDVELDPAVVDAARAIEDRVASALLGKATQVRIATAALLSGEHLLLNDLPGVGKTTLGAALAKVVDGVFGRIQGTPDLLPTDLTGCSVFNQGSGRWTYRPGPLLANVVLIDELNRITPRTQSALLQAMAEGHMTVDGVTRPVPRPFLVVATMNPAGSAGTFPLTSGQLDRFGATLALGAADRPTERRVLRGHGGYLAVDRIQAVLPAERLPDMQETIANVHVSDSMLDYVLDVCDALRPTGHISARGPRSILAMARALAVLEGRGYAVPDDVKTLAVPCLAHRLGAEGEPLDSYGPHVQAVLDDVAVPDLSRR
jgi:MoxR-like ATPase